MRKLIALLTIVLMFSFTSVSFSQEQQVKKEVKKVEKVTKKVKKSTKNCDKCTDKTKCSKEGTK